ncbi:exported hypothetical protein [Candidatus Zixiibacteriota bacterium]|nr:exported hypothetical protein [candidate division Zixibacteria bacterium]
MRKILVILISWVLPLSLSAALMKTYDQPLEGLSNNTVIDIITHKGDIWLATGKGMSYTEDGGNTWKYFGKQNGLVSEDMSAIYSDDINGRLWVAPNHTIEVGGTTYLYADGLAYTDDKGLNWDTLMIPGSYGPQSSIYDITGYDSLIFCASWAGGLFGSFDGGHTWKHIYYSIQDSINGTSSLRNLYFSAVLDTYHQDSIVLWAGTAAGLIRYIYAPAYAKPSSNNNFFIGSGDGYIYFSGDSGLSRLNYDSISHSERWHSAFIADGLPGRAVSAASTFGGRVFAGTLDSAGGIGTGLAVSDDSGLTFHTNYNGLGELIGAGKYPVDFAAIKNRLYLAGLGAGLFVSSDTGKNWQKIYVDSLNMDPADGRNVVNALYADSLNLLVGTDSGVVILFLDTAGIIDSARFAPQFSWGHGPAHGPTTRLKIQKFFNGGGTLDSSVIWAINQPRDTIVDSSAVFRSSDYGLTWRTDADYLTGRRFLDIDFIDASIYIVGYDTWLISPNGVNWYGQPGLVISDSLKPTVSLNKSYIRAIKIINDTIYLASSKGLAVAPAGSNNWHIVQANTNPTHFDRTDLYTSESGQLTGNFVTALRIQNLLGGEKLWITSQPADSVSYTGINTASLDGSGWERKDSGTVCWNYDFYQDEIFAATDAGLLYSANGGNSWDTISIAGTLANSVPPVPYAIGTDQAAYAVRVVGDTLWVGTSDGVAKIALAEIQESNWSIYRVVDPSKDIYAYPVPFSPYSGGALYFRYPLAHNAGVSISVYDFAMNLVKDVMKSEYRIGGPDAAYAIDKWDGRNGKGDIVAAGIYYFKVALSTGEVYWGKLAIVP